MPDLRSRYHSRSARELVYGIGLSLAAWIMAALYFEVWR